MNNFAAVGLAGAAGLAVTAGLGSDLPLLLGITVVSAAIVFGGNLVAGICHGSMAQEAEIRANDTRYRPEMA